MDIVDSSSLSDDFGRIIMPPPEVADDDTNDLLKRADQLASVEPDAAAHADDADWSQLPAELLERIWDLLISMPNVLACTLRQLDKARAALFSGPEHTRVRLSRFVPPYAFSARWAASGALRSFTLARRLQLLRLTAASGCVPNMEAALAAAACMPTSGVLGAAAAAGQLHMCEWLLQRGCPASGALEAAAGAGQLAACRWLIARRAVPLDPKAAKRAVDAAAAGGHWRLAEALAETDPHHFPRQLLAAQPRLLSLVAHGCDLATLQALHGEWHHHRWGLDAILAAAAASPTTDWRAKVEWLEGVCGYRQSVEACAAAAALPDARERLAWLEGRGYTLDDYRFRACEAPRQAVTRGDLDLLQYLWEELGLYHGRDGSWRDSRRSGHDAAESAARGGHVHVLAWMAERGLGGALLGSAVLDAAAAAGSLEAMAWLRGRGCHWATRAWVAAAGGGAEAALEWLAEHGCPFPDNGSPFVTACHNGDTATVNALARLGCPWGPPGQLFKKVLDKRIGGGAAAAAGGGGAGGPGSATSTTSTMTSSFFPASWLGAVRALLAAGCPLRPGGAAEAEARKLRDPTERRELLADLAELRRRRVQQDKGRQEEGVQGGQRG
ncbi:hypothetical protein GPECTOR_208g402 [Gonium pectorale]|uniref:Uncharacterized protein n=1 Tax=Gonium pectorale TaxID=33097 RepID=A0A150FYG7_GONPE|nr:hypothetical protein GPECTOR_208g402 [Gonium pectorale]|eukprot:KXZ42090.1 hypothetical protein GPECTOR_208g402 [Gonium pectorale]